MASTVAAGTAGTMLIGVLLGTMGAAMETDAELCGSTPLTSTATTSTTADIPPTYLQLYQQAAIRYGIQWQVLAAIGKVESDHGRDPDPNSGVHSGANWAGAMGPMQIMASEWAIHGQDGNGDGKKDIYDPADAIPAAAAKLHHDGAPAHLYQAIWHYNPLDSYVRKVLAKAREYSGGQDPQALPAQTTSDNSSCLVDALPPTEAASRVIAFARAQLGKPYLWGGTGPDAYDCSGLTQAAYHAAGIEIPRIAADQWHTQPHIPNGQQQPGDLVFFITDGTRDNPGHVAIVLNDHQMIASPHTGTVIQVQNNYAQRSDFVGYARPVRRT